jgi:hypothetical protein
MTPRRLLLLPSALLLSVWSAAASAHDGHGLAGSHWHATDSAGLVAVAALAALALWLSRGE